MFRMICIENELAVDLIYCFIHSFISHAKCKMPANHIYIHRVDHLSIQLFSTLALLLLCDAGNQHIQSEHCH